VGLAGRRLTKTPGIPFFDPAGRRSAIILNVWR